MGGLSMISFVVHGTPRPQGSKRHVGNGIMVESSKYVKTWRQDVAAAAIDAYKGTPLTGPVELHATFVFSRPKGHYGSGKNASRIKDSAPRSHTNKPDLDKVIRSTKDALKGIVWRDDSQVVSAFCHKVWGEAAHAAVQIVPVEVG